MPKIKQKRMGFSIDMTPLVDLTFLLLVFLMFTSTFKSDTENEAKFTVERPKASPDSTFLPEQDVATIQVGLDPNNLADTIMTYGVANPKVRAEVWDMVTEIPAEMKSNAVIVVRDSALMVKLLKTTNAVKSETIFTIDGDEKVYFKKIEEIMELLRVARIRTFNYVTDKQKAES